MECNAQPSITPAEILVVATMDERRNKALEPRYLVVADYSAAAQVVLVSTISGRCLS